MKIPVKVLPEIIRRRNEGETLTALAREFGVTPWAIQKRIGKRDRIIFEIWEYIPNYHEVVERLDRALQFAYGNCWERKEWLLDFVITLPPARQKSIKKQPTENWLYINLRQAFFSTFLKKKRIKKIIFSEK